MLTGLRRVADRIGPRWGSALALGAVLAISAAVLFANVRTQWFIYDEFDYLTPPEGSGWLGWLVTPHNEHTIVFTKLWFSILYQAIGLHGYALYAVPMLVSHLAAGVAVYLLLRAVVRSRAIAIAAVAPLMLMAAGAGTLTWAGQFQYTAATAAGLWLLWFVLVRASDRPSTWVWAVALTVFGTFSGSAFMPIGIAAGFALLSLRRYLLGVVVIAIPSIWFVVVRRLWDIPSYNSAHDLGQVLRDGPEFVFALLQKAVDDSIPVSGSFTPAVLVLATVGVLAFFSVPSSTPERPRARRVQLFLLTALTLSLAITLIGRLSRELADSASGGYSYFILIVAIPVFIATIARFCSDTRLSTSIIVLLLLGWAAAGAAALTTTSAGLASWKSGNATLLSGAAYLADEGFEVIGDRPPSPALGPTVSWSDLTAMAERGAITASPPSTQTADQLSLDLQWSAAKGAPSTEGLDCATIAAHDSLALPGDGFSLVTTSAGSDSQLTLSYTSSGAVRALNLPATGLTVDSVSGRDALLTAGDLPLTVCR
ncbi:hypothetical protein N1031_14715 [Herbiconiux moechotypicola]|uniref:Glycosyltransferase RgtA/B/C/D-like domain-containing protein n=1 Tax=Herbiconiux moechotypicola TaxID=637393 RepID=A0ABN3DUY7_9MICO|nr:hypothetical protein [Herbiconiux moechotypicola]MCS5731016.1 hypothetical protein [Herbiconiux moechotypicola]